MKNFYLLSVCFFGCWITVYAAGPVNPGCLEKEKALALLETAEDLLTKAKNTFPSCKDANSTDESECGGKKSLAYIEISMKMVSFVRKHFPTCNKTVVKYEKPRDCSQILASGYTESGVYNIWPSKNLTEKSIQVYCDMDRDDGGWTVIQRRGKFPVQQDFYQNWETYKLGFGNITQEFWLGNKIIYDLCQEECKLRFDLQAQSGERRYAVYQYFKLLEDYTIHIVDYKGNAGDSMRSHTLGKFSTKDAGNIFKANEYHAGWWYSEGVYSNLNGVYQPGISGKHSVFWWEFRGYENLANVEIKVMPK